MAKQEHLGFNPCDALNEIKKHHFHANMTTIDANLCKHGKYWQFVACGITK